MELKVYAAIGDDGEQFELGSIEDRDGMITRTDVAGFFEAVAKEFREVRPNDYVEIPESDDPWTAEG